MFVTPDGGLTAAGYVLFIVLALAALAAAAVIAGKASEKRTLTARQLSCGEIP